MYKRLKPLSCWWCGIEIRPRDDHHLWCGSRPRDAISKEPTPGVKLDKEQAR